MDLTAIDVTDVEDVQVGDIATIFGADGNTKQYAFDVAKKLGMVTAQVLVGIGWRVPRIYLR
jgi:alanine racemase